MSFDLFGPATKCDIKVGYISTDRGFVDGIGLYEANQEAKLNPGTQFIFRNRDKVQYLNINEVNNLVPDDMLPNKMSANDNCSGIVGLNLEGDTTKSIDDAFNLKTPIVGGTTKEGASDARDKTAVDFYGGGGVGVQAAPIIGIDGSVLAVQVIHGGYGYQYPPIVDISDDTGQGSGASAKAFIKTRSSDEDVLIEEFDAEEDYEEYDLERCAPEIEKIGYGQRWSPDGKDLGKWDPSVYFNKSKDPIRFEIEKYQKFLLALRDGSRIQNGRILQWWTSRQKPPLRVTSPNKVSREVYDVFHWAWGADPGKNDEIDNLYIKLLGRRGEPAGLEYWKNLRSSGQSLAQIEEGFKLQPEYKNIILTGNKPVIPDVTIQGGQFFEYDKDNFMNSYAISPVPSSNVLASDNAGKTFTLEWEEEFPYEGDYIFNVQCDNDAYLFINNDPISNDFHIGKGGAAGHILSGPASIKKHMPAGSAKITVDLFNHLFKEKKDIQEDVVATSDDVNFNVNISTLFAAGITIEGLDIDVSKEYGEGKDIKESLTRKVEYGRVYPVKVRSSNQRVLPAGLSSNQRELIIDGAATEPDDRRVSAGGKAYQFDNDGSDWDMNAVFRITSGNGRFEEVGGVPTIKGTGMQTIELWWNDTGGDEATGGDAAGLGKAIKTIRIGNTIWSAKSTYSSNKVKLKDRTRTIDLGPAPKVGGNNSSNLQLRTKGEKVLQMEDLPGQAAGSAGVGFFDDLICSVNNGRFYGISGSSCNFVVDAPVGNKGGSTGSQKGERTQVFNTVDFINKANRKLWKINSGVARDGDFINQFGVLPFDPNSVAQKRNDKSTVKFETGEDGKTYLKVNGTGRVRVGLRLNVNDNPRRAGLAVREVRIKADDGEIFMKRALVTRATDKGIGVFTAGRRYEVKILGGVGRRPIPNNAQDTIGLLDGHGNDWNADVKITSINQITASSASTDDYAGFHTIVWNNIVFPEDGNYAISTMVDDNATLTFSGRSSSANIKDVVLVKKGFRIRGDARTGTGKSVEIKYFKSGTYTLTAVLEQIQGNPLSNGNPMALAVDVKAAFVTKEVEVISNKSWNQNPMGFAMTIDAPMAPTPKEPPQLQKGRCPNNPIWSTRTTKDVDQIWYPVRVDAWSKFTNRYGISPLPPLGFKGTDGAGTVWRNTWRVELPYKGFYGVKGTVDNFGKLFIDGVEVLGPESDKKLESFKTESPTAKKIFLEEKTVEISIEIENDKQFIYNTIDKKVFSTADWAYKQTQTETVIEGAKNVDVIFKVGSSSDYGNSIVIDDLFEASKTYKGPQLNETFTRTIEVGKVYNVKCNSPRGREDLRITDERVLEMEDFKDGDYNDLACSATQGKFFNIKGNKCQFTVPFKNKTQITYGEALTSGSSKDGVTYSGPPLATYANSDGLGPYITPAFNGDEDYIANFNGKTFVMTFDGVNFEETGIYDIQAQADDVLLVKVDGVQVATAEVGKGITKTQFNVTEGRKKVELTLTNIQLNLPFSSNPTVAAVKITKKTQVAKVDPRTGTAQGKPWTVNPLGISAILIPPPCPKKINGVGIVTAVVITDPGNGFPTPVTPPDGDPPAGPPVILELDEVVPEDPGINYAPDDLVCIVNTETGEEICFTPPKGPFGEILPFQPIVTDPGPGDPTERVADLGPPRKLNGFRKFPEVIPRTSTGIGYKGVPRLKPVIDPIGVEPDRLIQVTDLPGLKQNGYYDGKPYYGAVFFEDGIRYAGYYDTPGQKVQIYDTLQESIDAEVTTPPSAIQRQGTDTGGDNPRLNIPGTPNNLT
tara:strand:+ start:1598 stop:6958 length:5361 start_codon:yes stop_codon:yes gene_type:complete